MGKWYCIENWHKYQARTDKELPWLKLWGQLFDKPWWQEMDDKNKIIPVVLLDAARRFNNKIPKKIDYYARNYNLKASQEEFVFVCKCLKINGFLSDQVVRPRASILVYSPSKSLKEEKDAEKEIPRLLEKKPAVELDFNALEAFNEFFELYPPKNRVKRSRALALFCETVVRRDIASRILKALVNYKLHLDANPWKQPQEPANWLMAWPDWENYQEPPKLEPWQLQAIAEREKNAGKAEN